MSRSKRVSRKTKETDVTVKLDLDGTGKYSIELPDKWLKHMLESVARFGQFDLEIKADGDFNHTSVLVLLDADGRIVARTERIGGTPDPAFVAAVRETLRKTPAHAH